MQTLTHATAIHLENGTGWWVFGFAKKSQPFAFNTITEAKAIEGEKLIKDSLASGPLTAGQAHTMLRRHFAPKGRPHARKQNKKNAPAPHRTATTGRSRQRPCH